MTVEDLSFVAGVAAATVYEANGKRGAAGPSIRAMLVDTPPVHGPAVTVRCWPGDARGVWQALAVAPPGSILVVDMGGTPDVTAFGSGTVKAALALGVRAIVANAALRDLRDIRALGLPVFAMGINLRGTMRVQDGTVGAEIVIGAATVRAGDLVVADDDGVIVVGQADIDQLRRALPDQLHKEATTDALLAQGKLP